MHQAMYTRLHQVVAKALEEVQPRYRCQYYKSCTTTLGSNLPYQRTPRGILEVTFRQNQVSITLVNAKTHHLSTTHVSALPRYGWYSHQTAL